MTSRAEDGGRSELEMSPEQMMASAQRAAELVIERIQNLPEEPAWRGGSRSELEAIMREEPPEEGRPSHEVIERAAHEILPIAGRVDHPRSDQSVVHHVGFRALGLPHQHLVAPLLQGVD